MDQQNTLLMCGPNFLLSHLITYSVSKPREKVQKRPEFWSVVSGIYHSQSELLYICIWGWFIKDQPNSTHIKVYENDITLKYDLNVAKKPIIWSKSCVMSTAKNLKAIDTFL